MFAFHDKRVHSRRTDVHKSAFEIKRDDWKSDDIDLIDEAAYRQHVADKSNQRCREELRRRKKKKKKTARPSQVEHDRRSAAERSFRFLAQAAKPFVR